MNAQYAHIVYITSLPRSGSTAIGTGLAAARGVAYIHEPFNPDCGVEGWDWRFRIPSDLDGRSKFRELKASRLRFKTALYPEDGPSRRVIKKMCGSRGGFHNKMNRLAPWRRFAVVKDPTAPLAAPVVARLGIPTVFVVRHPGAILRSYKRLGWDPRHDLALADRSLPSSTLPTSTSVESLTQVEAVGWLWELVTSYVALHAQIPNLTIVRYEDLLKDPLPGLSAMAAATGLPWDRSSDFFVKRKMSRSSALAARRDGPVQQLRRDAAALSQEREVLDRILKGTAAWPIVRQTFSEFYFDRSVPG